MKIFYQIQYIENQNQKICLKTYITKKLKILAHITHL